MKENWTVIMMMMMMMIMTMVVVVNALSEATLML